MSVKANSMRIVMPVFGMALVATAVLIASTAAQAQIQETEFRAADGTTYQVLVATNLGGGAENIRVTTVGGAIAGAGELGRLLDGARETKIHGQWMPVNAEVVELPMLSAHADSDELMGWLSGFQRAPQQVFIVHGEAQASEALRERIGRDLGWPATVPRPEQEFSL